jgi:hypothetical protein
VVVVLLIAVGFGLWIQNSSRPAAIKPAVTANPAIEMPAPLIAARVAGATPHPAKNGDLQVIDVCGMGRVTIDRDNPYLTWQAINRTAPQTRSQWLSGMLSSGDARIRATGLFLENKIGDDDWNRPPSEEAVNSLVKIALESKDPAVYTLALQECIPLAGAGPGGACEQINLEKWASMDRDNAAPWLALAHKAHDAGDTTAEYSAYAQASKAKVLNSYSRSLVTYAEPALPADTRPLDRYNLMNRLVGIEGMSPLSQFSTVSRYCSVEAASDPTIRSQCNALAELLTTKASMLLERLIGTSIGTRMGWPEERQSALRERLDALRQLNLEGGPTGAESMWSCDVVTRTNAFMSEWARLGEIGADEERLERSGKTVAELALKYPVSIAEIMRQAQAQAAATSPK